MLNIKSNSTTKKLLQDNDEATNETKVNDYIVLQTSLGLGTLIFTSENPISLPKVNNYNTIATFPVEYAPLRMVEFVLFDSKITTFNESHIYTFRITTDGKIQVWCCADKQQIVPRGEVTYRYK